METAVWNMFPHAACAVYQQVVVRELPEPGEPHVGKPRLGYAGRETLVF